MDKRYGIFHLKTAVTVGAKSLPNEESHEHSYCTKTTIFHTVAGKEVWDITSGKRSHSDSEGQQLM
jgi:hypothetical protein